MPRHVVSPLTLHPPTYDAARAARMWDAVKWNIKLSRLTDSTLPGFYMHKGVLHEVRYVLPPPPPPPPQQTQTWGVLGQSHFGSQQAPVSARGSGILSFSANAPIPQDYGAMPEYFRLWEGTAARLELQPVTDKDEAPQPFAYTMDMAFGDLTGGGGAVWIPGPPFPPLKFRCMVDTGGRGHMWTYCVYGGAYGLTGPNTRVKLTDDDVSMLIGKAKYPRGKEGNAYKQFVYGNRFGVDVQPVTPKVTGIFDFDGTITRIPRYMYGLAIGFAPMLLPLPFDGIVGLGRSHSAPHALGGIGIVRQMVTQKVIQDETFYICCRSKPVGAIGYGFVSFGGWPTEYALEPQWQEINLHPQADEGMWELHLLEINLFVPGHGVYSEKPDCKVRLDNATTDTLLPEEQAMPLIRRLKDLSLAFGFTSYDVDTSIEVELVFNSPTPIHRGLFSNRTVPIRGNARDFFIVHDPNPGPRLSTVGAIPAGNPHVPKILGVNFFRTFVLGFCDKPHGPTVLIAPQL